MSAPRAALVVCAVMAAVPPAAMREVLRGSFHGVFPTFLLSVSVRDAPAAARDSRARRCARVCVNFVFVFLNPFRPVHAALSQATHFQVESAEKTGVFDKARMLVIIAAGDYAGFHDYVRESATSYFDYVIPAWFGAMVMWVCKQTYVVGVVGSVVVLDGIVITSAKKQMYEILEDEEDENFRNAWTLMPSNAIIVIPAAVVAPSDAGSAPAAAAVTPAMRRRARVTSPVTGNAKRRSSRGYDGSGGGGGGGGGAGGV